VRVPGHRLIARGAPHTAESCQKWPCDLHSGVQRVNRQGDIQSKGIGGHGHAVCECQWTGRHLLTGADRKRDHHKHKQDVRERLAAA
jgi:hypothetical protein